MLFGEQHEQQDAQCVDIGRGRDRFTHDLFRCRVLGGERSAELSRHPRTRSVTGFIDEKLGNPEVEQLDLPLFRDQHVRWLEVAVDDQIRMGVCDGSEDVQKQNDAPLDIEAARVAELVDRLAVDVLEHEERLSTRRHAGVEELGDLRMRQSRENSAFGLESRLTMLGERQVEKLDRRQAFEAPVAAFGEPDAAHATVPDRRFERVRPKFLAGERRGGDRRG